MKESKKEPPTGLQKAFGRLVAAHRKKRSWTQDQLAEAASMSVDMISRIEVGATGVRFASIDKLAKALEVNPAELFSADMPTRADRAKPLTRLTTRLSSLSEGDLAWIAGVIDSALKTRG